jgi:hypothetical protein
VGGSVFDGSEPSTRDVTRAKPDIASTTTVPSPAFVRSDWVSSAAAVPSIACSVQVRPMRNCRPSCRNATAGTFRGRTTASMPDEVRSCITQAAKQLDAVLRRRVVLKIAVCRDQTA